jgi:hypothetical protein
MFANQRSCSEAMTSSGLAVGSADQVPTQNPSLPVPVDVTSQSRSADGFGFWHLPQMLGRNPGSVCTVPLIEPRIIETGRAGLRLAGDSFAVSLLLGSFPMVSPYDPRQNHLLASLPEADRAPLSPPGTRFDPARPLALRTRHPDASGLFPHYLDRVPALRHGGRGTRAFRAESDGFGVL